MARATDSELLARISAGDFTAFQMLYERHSPAALRLAGRICGFAHAQDAAQEAFINVWQHAASYDPARGNASSWLLGIVRNRALDALRRAAVGDRTLAAAEHQGPPPPPDSSTEQEVIRRDEAERIRTALRALPFPQREAVAMAYLGGLSTSEIALKTHTPMGTVKGRIRLGRQKLQRTLADEARFTLRVGEA
jgi:RNA polymerase sigma-70 factor, ECF subfamily